MYLLYRFVTAVNYSVILNKTNDHPPLILTQPVTIYFIEDESYTSVFPALIISDRDIICDEVNNIKSAKISLTGRLDSDQEFLFVSFLNELLILLDLIMP